MKIVGLLFLCGVILVNGQDDPTTVAPAPTDPPTTKLTTPEPPMPPPTTNVTTTTTVKPPAPAPPAPTPKPGPVIPEYPHNVGKWSTEDANNASCIALKGAMQIVVVTSQNQTIPFSVPPFAVATGSCEEHTITLTWDSPVLNANKTGFQRNLLTLAFESNSTKLMENGISQGKYGLQNITVELYTNSTTQKEQPIKRGVVNQGRFQTPFNHSFSCLAEEPIKSEDGKFTFKIREVQLEAFRSTPPGHREFSAAVECAADDAADYVPIAVGASLAGLVVIVLIAYLIGRRRSRARGYQSV